MYEAEHLKTIDNQLLGHFEICDIPKAKRGEVSIAVTFEVDINGILSVSARDLSSKTANEMRVLYDKGSLDLGAKYDELAMPLRTSASSDNKKMEVALKDFANVIHKAMGEDRDCPLIPLELAMNQRSCNRTLMKLCHSTDEVSRRIRNVFLCFILSFNFLQDFTADTVCALKIARLVCHILYLQVFMKNHELYRLKKPDYRYSCFKNLFMRNLKESKWY